MAGTACPTGSERGNGEKENAYYVKIRVKRSEGSTTNPAAFVVRLHAQGNIGG